VIKVAAGAYTSVSARQGITQVVYISKTVTLQGGYTTTNWTTPDPELNITTLDARGQGRVFFITETDDIVIDGLYITGGDASEQLGGEHGQGAGGGLLCWIAQISLTNNHIFENTSGGMYTGFCSGDIIGNTFSENIGTGLYLHASGPVYVIENVFDSNSGIDGGGMWVDNTGAYLYRNIFTHNTAVNGGGLFLYLSGPMNEDGSPATKSLLNENIIVSNTAERGGGLVITNDGSGTGTLTNTVIVDNQASIEGAGIYITQALNVQLLQTTLARNRGGDGSGVCIGESSIGGQEPWHSTVVMTNTIVAFQDIGIRVSEASTLTVNGVLWFANTDDVWQSNDATVYLSNEHTGDPLFINPDFGDYHIGELSAARDMGVPSGVTWDIDGERRPMGPAWDLGADEYFLNSIFLPLTQRN
jgi:hypothetical protein